MVALAPSPSSRQPRYRGRPSARLPRSAIGRALAGTFALALALASGGCSFSYQLDSLFGKSKNDGASLTGSIRPAVSPTPTPIAQLPAAGDLAMAKAAASEVLSKGGKDASLPWENPQTGVRGTVTPIASAYNQDGLTCRDFLASFVRDGNEAWLQGEACRVNKGKWEVRHFKPWQRAKSTT